MRENSGLTLYFLVESYKIGCDEKVFLIIFCNVGVKKINKEKSPLHIMQKLY